MRKRIYKPSNLHTLDIEQEIPIENGQEFAAKLKVSIRWVNNGIGKYECWGAIGFDNQYEWELYEVTHQTEPSHYEIVETFIENNEDKIKEAAISQLAILTENL